MLENNIDFERAAIRETPPTVEELEKMLGFMDGELKKLFNSSGQEFRKLNLKEKLPTLSQKEALELLASNGNLVKRPFVIGSDKGIVGFKEEFWQELFS